MIDWSKPYSIPDIYNLPRRDQSEKNNCTSHAFAYLIEVHLSNHFKERTVIDVDDLWEKQLKYGTATDQGDFPEGPFIIATKYGVRFLTDSGKHGTLFLTGEKANFRGINAYVGWNIVLD